MKKFHNDLPKYTKAKRKKKEGMKNQQRVSYNYPIRSNQEEISLNKKPSIVQKNDAIIFGPKDQYISR